MILNECSEKGQHNSRSNRPLARTGPDEENTDEDVEEFTSVESYLQHKNNAKQRKVNKCTIQKDPDFFIDF